MLLIQVLEDSADSVCKIYACGVARVELIAIFQRVALLEALSQGLHVGANDIADPAHFGVAVDFVDTGFLLAKTIPQSFYRDIESDFVPKRIAQSRADVPPPS